VQPIFSEADAADTLFLFTVFGDKKSKCPRGISGMFLEGKKHNRIFFYYCQLIYALSQFLYAHATKKMRQRSKNEYVFL
jgi:hypothetical protein